MYEISVGDRFGRLTVESEVSRGRFECICECGNKVVALRKSLGSGHTSSCGCLRRDRRIEKITTHGMSNTKLYYIWCGIKSRCTDKSNPFWEDYGGRGIKVCERWENSFIDFMEDVGLPPDGMSIDRIDNNGDYCKENCRWATKSKQQRNRRDSITLTYNGRTQTLSDWADELGVPYDVLRGRRKMGWSDGDILTRPIYSKGKLN